MLEGAEDSKWTRCISFNHLQEKQQQQEQKTTNARVFYHIRGIRAPL